MDTLRELEDKDVAAITQAAMDYAEGWYTGTRFECDARSTPIL